VSLQERPSLKKLSRPARRRKKNDVIIANSQLKKAEAAAVVDPPAAEPATRNVLTTTQWLSVISIFLSVVGIYYKREEIKRL